MFPLLKSETTHHYEALPYVWGNPGVNEPLEIVVNGHDFPVTPNLYSALLHLRDDFVERTLSIDAVCINQKEDVEKGHQVQSMAKIYAKASRVIVWLGEPAVDSGEAFSQLLMAARIHRSDSADPEGSGQYPSVLSLLRRPWFQRIWVSDAHCEIT